MSGNIKWVLRTPIAPGSAEDKPIWHGDRAGKYTVKSDYKLISTMASDRHLEVEEHWHLLWGLKISSKVRDCLWGLGQNCLPHKVNLLQKRVVDEKWCVLCVTQLEDTWHVFFNYLYALQCCDKVCLRDKLERAIINAESLLDAFFAMLGDNDRNTTIIFGMVTWQIWKKHNSMMWDNVKVTNRDCVLSVVMLREWIQAKLAATSINEVSCTSISRCQL